jgi:ATP-binding cassette, subfamily B, bacterial
MSLRLPRLRRPRIPVIQQLTETECGAACLAMVLAHHGRHVRVDEVRDVLDSGRDGSTALALIEAARQLGLDAWGARLEPEALDQLPRGSVLHWNFSHYVVFEGQGRRHVDIIDPAMGRRRVSRDELGRCFTGVALVFERTPAFQPGGARSRGLKAYLGQLVSDWRQWLQILVVSLLLQALGAATPFATKVIVDAVIPREDVNLLSVLAVGLAGVAGFYFLSTLMRHLLFLHVQTKVDAAVTMGFLQHMLRLPFAFFQRRSIGDLTMRVNSNTTIREVLTGGVLSTLLDGGMAGFYLVVLLVASPSLGLVAAGLAVIEVLAFLITRRLQREYMSRYLHTQAQAESALLEILGGIETLKANGFEDRAFGRWRECFIRVLNVSVARGRLAAVVEAVESTVGLCSPLVILGVGTFRVLSGELSLGAMLALSALAAGFLAPFSSLVSNASRLQLLRSYVERINDVLDTAPEQDRAGVTPSGPLRGQITLDGVGFRYAESTPWVLEDVSFEVRPGETVALVGRTGSGKSTLWALLAGLYRPTRGRILYDGRDLRGIELTSLRRQLGIVPQRPQLFAGTIRQNIAFGRPDASLADVQAAARSAQIHVDIEDMPMGYDTPVVEGGASLSGGQRQRLVLARALLQRPRILLLDEATSALDAVTEGSVRDALTAMGCTRFIIAHRMSTIIEADRILVLEGGRVIAAGRHADLMRGDSVYPQLVAAG